MKTLIFLLFSIGVFAQDTIPNIDRDTVLNISFVKIGNKVEIKYLRYNSTISNKQLIEWLIPLLKEIYKKEENEPRIITN